MLEQIIAPPVRTGEDGAVQAWWTKTGPVRADDQMALPLGAFHGDMIVAADSARDPAKGIAFHAGYRRAIAQRLLCHAVAAHQFADQPKYGIVPVAVREEPGAIAAQQDGRGDQNQSQDQAAPQTAIATLFWRRRITGRRHGRWRWHGHGIIPAQALD